MNFLKKIVNLAMSRQSSFPRGKEGCRAYAIGDIHGRLDLLEDILAQIEADMASRTGKRTFIVFLGDLIDRGPSSSGVVERLCSFDPEGARPIFLSGNHEEVFLKVLRGDTKLLRDWLSFGGSECVESYGLNATALGALDDQVAIDRIRAAIPARHRRFIEDFSDTFKFGDYLFVHAGIRPGVGLEHQDGADLRWIRDPFLTDDKEHGFVVVHGHTITKEVDERTNRIGIDTGAYRTELLTALAIEDGCRWYLSTSRSEGS